MKFDADLSNLDKGIWRVYDDVEFRLTHISNIRFQRSLAKHQQPYRRKLTEGTLDPKISQEILCKAMGEAIIIDWRGKMADSQGNQIPYTSENASYLLNRDPDFRDWVAAEASNMAAFRIEEVRALGEG